VIVDSSAIVAILTEEPEKDAFDSAIAGNPSRISSFTYLEASIALCAKRGDAALSGLDIWIETSGVEIVPFTTEHARIAREAWLQFGKGQHDARLNFGDCATYALASSTGEPLLYKGDDFGKTDIEPAI
jgi:ribonuclease VapC